MITGPIIPKAYATSNSDSPTPDLADAVTGEIIVCTKTGRMWVKWRTDAMVPIRPEFSYDHLIYGEVLSGVRGQVVGSGAGASLWVEVYGAGLKVLGFLEPNGYNQITGSFTCNTSTSFEVSATMGTNGNAPHLKGPKPTISNLGFTTLGDQYWFSVTGSLGVETGDFTGGVYRLNTLFSNTKAQFERVIEANDGLKITDLPRAYVLGTSATGQLVNRIDNYTDTGTVLTADYTLTAIGTDEEIDSAFRQSVGATGETHKYLLTLTVNAYFATIHTSEFKIRNHTNSVDLVGGRFTAVGYGCGTITWVLTTTAALQLRVYGRSNTLATFKATNSTSVPTTVFTVTRLA